MDRPIIGIDIGWSRKRKSCGVAVGNSRLPLPNAIRYGRSVRCARMTLASLLELGASWRRSADDDLANAVIVIDGPMGSSGPPVANRRIDAACSGGGFKGRCQPMPVEHPSSAAFVRATHDVLEALGVADRVWCSGRVTAGDALVIETNPTVALAVAVEKQRTDRLPTRRRARVLRVDDVDRVIRAKSDWYWEIGGDAVVWRSLELGGVPSEHDHERIAALTCIAIAAEFAAGNGVAVGDRSGVYGLLRKVDASWADDVRALGLVAAQARFGRFPALAGIDEQVPLLTLSFPVDASDRCAPADDVDWQRGEDVDLLLCDSGGVNEAQNAWLVGCESPIDLNLALPMSPVRHVTLSHGAGRARNPVCAARTPSSAVEREARRSRACWVRICGRRGWRSGRRVG